MVKHLRTPLFSVLSAALVTLACSPTVHSSNGSASLGNISANPEQQNSGQQGKNTVPVPGNGPKEDRTKPIPENQTDPNPNYEKPFEGDGRPSGPIPKQRDIVSRNDAVNYAKSANGDALVISLEFKDSEKVSWTGNGGRVNPKFETESISSLLGEFEMYPQQEVFVNKNAPNYQSIDADGDNRDTSGVKYENQISVVIPAGFDPEKVGSLCASLGEYETVLTVSLARWMAKPPSAHYVTPPSDNMFEYGVGWKALDPVNRLGGPKESFQNLTGQYLGNWWYNRHSIGAGWDSGGFKGYGKRVAVIDQHFSTSISDIIWDMGYSRRFISGASVYDSVMSFPSLPSPGTWTLDDFKVLVHGTACAGLVSAGIGGGAGVGTAPQSTIVPVRAVGGSQANVIAAINYARTDLIPIGVKVLLIEADIVEADWVASTYSPCPVVTGPSA